MKARHFICWALWGLFLSLAGCMKADMMERSEGGSATSPFDAIVTVKQLPDGTVFFQVDEDLRICPTRYDTPFTGLKRLACRLQVTGSLLENGCYPGTVLWSEELERGEISYALDALPDDGLDLLDDWMTSVEDGFLTLHYSTWWGKGTIPHLVLLSPGNPGDPYELHLLHYRNGDEALEEADALIYFDLDGALPSTDGATLTLKWKTSAGTSAEKQFLYKSRR